MPTVRHQITAPGGTQLADVRARLRLITTITGEGSGYVGVRAITGDRWDIPDADGYLEWDTIDPTLTEDGTAPHPDLVPAGAMYGLTLYRRDDGFNVEYEPEIAFHVWDVDTVEWVGERIDDPPGTLETPAVGVLRQDVLALSEDVANLGDPTALVDAAVATSVPPAVAAEVAGIEADGDAAGPLDALVIQPDAVTTPKVADQNITPPKLIAEDENGVAFRFDPSDLADGDLLPAPWVDARDLSATENFEDRLGIRRAADGSGVGAIAEVEFRGPQYTVPIPPDIVAGHRGLAYVDTPWSASGPVGFEVDMIQDWTVPTAGGAPMVCFTPDDDDHGVGSFIVEPLDWFELGPIGRRPEFFRYWDTCPSDLSLIPDPANVRVRLFVLHGYAWALVNGVRRTGPVPIPAGLLESRRHGVAPDYGAISDDGCIKSVEVKRYDGPVALDYPPAAITAGTITKGTAATSRAVSIPNGIAIGDWVVMPFSANATITTPTGWTLAASVTEGSFRARLYARRVDGTEPWFGLPGQTLTVVHGSSISGGGILRLTEANPHRPLTATLSSDTANDTTATIPTAIAWGPHRSSFAFVMVPADRTVTFPTGWTPLAATTPGGAALTIAVATVADWTDPPAPLQLAGGDSPVLADYTNGGRETGVQLATLSSASTCLTGHVMVGPDQEGAPA